MSTPQPFCLLQNRESYVACDWNLVDDAAGRHYWIEFFVRHLQTILKLGVDAATALGESPDSAIRRAAACTAEFNPIFLNFDSNPQAAGRVTILTLDTWRDQILRRHGFTDAFADLKARENQSALPLLPAVCGQIDSLAHDPLQQLTTVIQGVFAGNIFDMGADATAKIFLHQGPDFFQTRQALKKRPWLIDDFDRLADRLLSGPLHRKAVFFIDNAGSDFLLGALPMIRWLAQRGTSVVLAANERPTLNDMTIHDVNAFWPRIVEIEPSLETLPIQRISTGTGEPLIDLLAVSPELNQAIVDVDLVILEGMGRGVESNLRAAFKCDALNLAMLKDQAIAARCGGSLFDVVCRFR